MAVCRWVGPSLCAPTRAYMGDAGWDLVVENDVKIPVDGFANVSLGIRIELPLDAWAMVMGRSSTIHKRGLLVVPAVIDSGYRGPMFAAVRNLGSEPAVVEAGQRIAQLIPFPLLAHHMLMERVETLSSSDRGERGFGSTGGFV